VVTVEGLQGTRKLSRLQRAFLECGAAQCGICTPGMLMAAAALPEQPTLAQIREGLAGNLCRCTGYMKIYDAVASALDGERVEALELAVGAASGEARAEKRP
jgi:carbon-monoxide dehydrogenase small subunit